MGEWFPSRMTGRPVFANIGMESVTILTEEKTDIFFMTKDRAVRINELVQKQGIQIGDNKLDVWMVIDSTPGVFGRTINDLDEYAKNLAKYVGRKIGGRKIVVWFSGGKDSTATLVVLLKLLEYINFHIEVFYIHVPYLDGERNIRFAEEAAKKLSVDLHIESMPRDVMLDLLRERGLPFRGYRWCTYHSKIKVMRGIKKRLRADYEVSSERVFESVKRLKSLREYAKQEMFISGSQFKPTYLLTILDVADICRRNDVIHPDYLLGCSRVSCSLCPYRTILEADMTSSDVEDPGTIDITIREEYRRWYRATSYDDFIHYRLWRFSPSIAPIILLLKKALEGSQYQYMKMDVVRNMVSWMWMNDIEAPYIPIRAVIEIIRHIRNFQVAIANLNLRIKDISG